MNKSTATSSAGPMRGLMRRPEMVLIDLDGTLVDSVPDLAYCVDAMMTRLDLPKRGEAQVRKWVGNGVERLVRRALTGSLDREPEPSLLERALPVFFDLYSKNYCVRSRLYPGVREGLDFLRRDGYKLGCVTNKPEAFTVPLLKALKIYDAFGIVVSGDSLPEKKPHPLPLLHAADHFAVDPIRALMVGDSVHDVEAARAAGFQVVCVSYGYNHGLDIRDAQPEALIDSLAELEYLLANAPPAVTAETDIT